MVTVIYATVIVMGVVIAAIAVLFVLKHVSNRGTNRTQQPTAENKKRLPSLRKRLDTQQRDIAPSQPDIDGGEFMSKLSSLPLPAPTNISPEVEVTATSLPPDREALNAEPMNQEPPEENAAVDLITAPVNQEPPEENAVVDLITAPLDAEANEELETAETKPAKSDSALDLFSSEIEEESDTSKFAASLNNVDINELMEEAHNLLNQLER